MSYFAADKKEAVEEIAAYNSEFATKNPDTLLFKSNNIDTDTMERFNLGYEVNAVDYSIANSCLPMNMNQKAFRKITLSFLFLQMKKILLVLFLPSLVIYGY